MTRIDSGRQEMTRDDWDNKGLLRMTGMTEDESDD